MTVFGPLPPAASAIDSLHILYLNADHAGYRWSDDIDAGTFIDILARKPHEQEMRMLRDYLISTINAMSSVIAAVDSDMAITLWNNEAESVTDIPRHEAIGKPVAQVLPVLSPHMALISRAMETGGQARFLIPGRSILFRQHIDIWIFPTKSFAAGNAVIRIDDITERIRMDRPSKAGLP